MIAIMALVIAIVLVVLVGILVYHAPRRYSIIRVYDGNIGHWYVIITYKLHALLGSELELDRDSLTKLKMNPSFNSGVQRVGTHQMAFSDKDAAYLCIVKHEEAIKVKEKNDEYKARMSKVIKVMDVSAKEVRATINIKESHG